MPTPRKTTRPNHMTPDERAFCVALYLKGATLDELEEIFDRARNTICRAIRRAGANRGRRKNVDNFQKPFYVDNSR